MAHEPSSPTSATLQPPQKSVELEDPGAHELGAYHYRTPLEMTDAIAILDIRTHADSSCSRVGKR